MTDEDNVDICFTCVGTTPPSLPLREELNSLGYETVHNAHGILEQAVQHEFVSRVSLLPTRTKLNECRRTYSHDWHVSDRATRILAEAQRQPSALSYDEYVRHHHAHGHDSKFTHGLGCDVRHGVRSADGDYHAGAPWKERGNLPDSDAFTAREVYVEFVHIDEDHEDEVSNFSFEADEPSRCHTETSGDDELDDGTSSGFLCNVLSGLLSVGDVMCNLSLLFATQDQIEVSDQVKLHRSPEPIQKALEDRDVSTVSSILSPSMTGTESTCSSCSEDTQTELVETRDNQESRVEDLTHTIEPEKSEENMEQNTIGLQGNASVCESKRELQIGVDRSSVPQTEGDDDTDVKRLNSNPQDQEQGDDSGDQTRCSSQQQQSSNRESSDIKSYFKKRYGKALVRANSLPSTPHTLSDRARNVGNVRTSLPLVASFRQTFAKFSKPLPQKATILSDVSSAPLSPVRLYKYRHGTTAFEIPGYARLLGYDTALLQRPEMGAISFPVLFQLHTPTSESDNAFRTNDVLCLLDMDPLPCDRNKKNDESIITVLLKQQGRGTIPRVTLVWQEECKPNCHILLHFDKIKACYKLERFTSTSSFCSSLNVLGICSSREIRTSHGGVMTRTTGTQHPRLCLTETDRCRSQNPLAPLKLDIPVTAEDICPRSTCIFSKSILSIDNMRDSSGSASEKGVANSKTVGSREEHVISVDVFDTSEEAHDCVERKLNSPEWSTHASSVHTQKYLFRGVVIIAVVSVFVSHRSNGTSQFFVVALLAVHTFINKLKSSYSDTEGCADIV